MDWDFIMFIIFCMKIRVHHYYKLDRKQAHKIKIETIAGTTHTADKMSYIDKPLKIAL